jgi:PAS domain-containing protein
MAQKEIELILMRQCASYLAMPIFLAGSDESLLYYNEPAEALLGRRFDEAGEITLADLPSMFHLTDENGSPLPLDNFPLGIALRQHRPAHGRVRYRSLDGNWRAVEVTAFPLEGEGRRNLGAVAIFWDAYD